MAVCMCSHLLVSVCHHISGGSVSTKVRSFVRFVKCQQEMQRRFIFSQTLTDDDEHDDVNGIYTTAP